MTRRKMACVVLFAFILQCFPYTVLAAESNFSLGSSFKKLLERSFSSFTNAYNFNSLSPIANFEKKLTSKRPAKESARKLILRGGLFNLLDSPVKIINDKQTGASIYINTHWKKKLKGDESIPPVRRWYER